MSIRGIISFPLVAPTPSLRMTTLSGSVVRQAKRLFRSWHFRDVSMTSLLWHSLPVGRSCETLNLFSRTWSHMSGGAVLKWSSWLSLVKFIQLQSIPACAVHYTMHYHFLYQEYSSMCTSWYSFIFVNLVHSSILYSSLYFYL